MRTRFDEQLEQLNVELIKMGALCEEALTTAVRALLSGDGELLPGVFETDREIDRAEGDIEARCMRLLLQQQPVARDLRAISAALKMISDMERIGDQAADIAELAGYLAGDRIPERLPVEAMAGAAVGMVTDSIDAFVRKDLEAARAVIARDDEVDDLFVQIKAALTELLRSGGLPAEHCLDLLMVAKYLERIGDHATNIAEWVEFSITGIHRNDEVNGYDLHCGR